MRKILNFYIVNKRYYNIGLLMSFIGGLIVYISKKTLIPLLLMIICVVLWFLYDYIIKIKFK